MAETDRMRAIFMMQSEVLTTLQATDRLGDLFDWMMARVLSPPILALQITESERQSAFHLDGLLDWLVEELPDDHLAELHSRAAAHIRDARAERTRCESAIGQALRTLEGRRFLELGRLARELLREHGAQSELVRVRWEEHKRLNPQAYPDTAGDGGQ